MKQGKRARIPFRVALTLALVSAMVLSTFSSLPQAFADTAPQGVTGRILTAEQAGDNTSWIEIARSGNYSLIVRSSYININERAAKYGDPTAQYADYQSSIGVMNYSSSYVRNYVNRWFNGNAPGSADTLSGNARLRNYTMQNNAVRTPGTATSQGSQTNGFSAPGSAYARTGDDVAFILSFSESMQFISLKHDIRGRSPQTAYSNDIAQANFARLTIPHLKTYCMFTRSPGDCKGTVGAMDYTGRLFQIWGDPCKSTEKGLIYPALWVDQSIWGPTTATINVRHIDSRNGDILRSNSYTVNVQPGSSTTYGPYNAGNFENYDVVGLASYSDPAQGTINAGETKNVTWLYTPALREAYIIVRVIEAQTGAVLFSQTHVLRISGPTPYGPYYPPQVPPDFRIVQDPGSDPASGTIYPGQTIIITWLAVRVDVASTINVYHKDAQTGATITSNTYTLNISQPTSYGPYNAINVTGYQAGVLASYSDPAQGTINPGDTKTVTWLYTRNMQTAKVNVRHVDATTGALLLHEEYTFDINQPTTYGHYSSKNIPGYNPGVWATYSDPASGIINPAETKNIVYQYTKAAVNAYVNVYHVDSQTGAVLKADNFVYSITAPTAYGPFTPEILSGYQRGVVAPFGDPASGTINPGETKLVIFICVPIPIISTINVIHKDAVTGAVLQSESFTLIVNQTTTYGPYNARYFTGYGDGFLAPGSDPASGTITPGGTKNITWLYNRGSATIYVLCINMATNNTIRIDTLTVPAGNYGPINPPAIAGFVYRGVHPSLGDPPSGTVDTNQTKVVVFQYASAVD